VTDVSERPVWPSPPRFDSAIIRSAEPNDLDLVYALVRELAEYEKLQGEVTATKTDLAAALFCADPKVYCEIAEVGGRPAGFALWFYSFSTFRGRHGVWLEDLFVRPNFRRGGIGTALVARLAARCQAEGLGRLEWSVLDWNRPAIAFYETLGARLMSEWTNCRIEGEALLGLCAETKTAP
jgi:GNAT superfamily N-acetyltransferase